MIIDISKITLENISKYNENKIRRCLVCNEEFEATYRKQEVCSQKCRQKYYYKNRKKSKEDKQ